MTIARPPLDEQRAIAGVLSTIQRAIEATDKVIAATRKLKASLMRHLFTYGPVPVADAGAVELQETEIGTIPAHWKVIPLGGLAKLESGGTPSKQQLQYWSGDIPWVSPKDMHRLRLADAIDHISQAALDSGIKVVSPGTILLTVRGMALANGFPVAIVDAPVAFNQDLKAAIPGDMVLPDYLLEALVFLGPQVQSVVGTSAHGTRRLGTSQLAELLVPTPPKDEQAVIAAAMRAVEGKIEAEDKRRSTLHRLFESSLRTVMTGQARLGELTS